MAIRTTGTASAAETRRRCRSAATAPSAAASSGPGAPPSPSGVLVSLVPGASAVPVGCSVAPLSPPRPAVFVPRPALSRAQVTAAARGRRGSPAAPCSRSSRRWRRGPRARFRHRGDAGLLGRVVDGGGDPVHPVELLLDAGRAGGAGHPADRELGLGGLRRGGPAAVVLAMCGLLGRAVGPFSPPVSASRAGGTPAGGAWWRASVTGRCAEAAREPGRATALCLGRRRGHPWSGSYAPGCFPYGARRAQVHPALGRGVRGAVCAAGPPRCARGGPPGPAAVRRGPRARSPPRRPLRVRRPRTAGRRR